MEKLPLMIRSENSPIKRESTNVQRALDDRLNISEAIEAVGRMLRGFNQAKDRSYVGAMAEYLTRYPRQVALACADPFSGVVAGSKYLPTPSDVISFCERKMRPMLEEAERERRIAQQLRARDEIEFDEREIEHRKKLAGAWLKRLDERAVELSGEKPKVPMAKEEIEQLLSSAKTAANKINAGDLKLSAEVIELMRVRDKTRGMDEAKET